MKNWLAVGLVAASTLVAQAELKFKSVLAKGEDGSKGKIVFVNDGEESVNASDYKLLIAKRGKKLKLEDAVQFDAKSIGANEEYTYKTKDVKPKNFPYLVLYKGEDIVDTAKVPVDLVDGATYDILNGLIGESKVGPQIGPLYGIKDAPSDLAPLATAKTNEDYTVTFAVNPLKDETIDGVDLLYRADFGSIKSLSMTKGDYEKKNRGQLWTAVIPAEDIPEAGKLLQLAANIKVGENTYRSPAFRNPDDGYEWYGTVVNPEVLNDSKLVTWHLFVTGESISQMDVDIDSQDTKKVPYGARAAIWDSQTGQYYDNVRIDLRGNTSATYRKKSHAYKFAKCLPYTGTNPFDGAEIEIRKTSTIAEYCDPCYLHQSLSFYIFRQVGSPVPFDYPVRLNLNGEFYQLAMHSVRFTDEYLEDYLGLDGDGYGYKNSGCLSPTLTSWVTIEKKMPDDDDETSAAALEPLKNWTTSFGATMVANKDDQTTVTKEVVKTFDLPAWINYLAAARITMEGDDSWANLSTYWDKEVTGTWRPLGYDFSQSMGFIYYAQWKGTKPAWTAEEDKFKAHPLFGGRRVLCYFANGTRSHSGSENWAMEAIWQSTKFRRMYLRRLRTLMDEQLKEPGTSKEATPFWDYVVAFTNATAECAALDNAKWRYDSDWTSKGVYCWDKALSVEEGVEDMWEHYIVPRRHHLFDTHSVTNTAKTIGYGQNLNAGIPLSQPATADLKDNFALVLKSHALIIYNHNDVAVDMSGWKLKNACKFTLPEGTVIDANDVVYVVEDRKSFIEENDFALLDQVIVGNAEFDIAGNSNAILQDANKVTVASVEGHDAAAEKENLKRWFNSSKNGSWQSDVSRTWLDAEIDIYTPSAAQPTDFVTIDTTLNYEGEGEMPTSVPSGAVTGLIIHDGKWLAYSSVNGQWTELTGIEAPAAGWETAIRTIYNRRTGKATFYADGILIGSVQATGAISHIAVGTDTFGPLYGDTRPGMIFILQ